MGIEKVRAEKIIEGVHKQFIKGKTVEPIEGLKIVFEKSKDYYKQETKSHHLKCNRDVVVVPEEKIILATGDLSYNRTIRKVLAIGIIPNGDFSKEVCEQSLRYCKYGLIIRGRNREQLMYRLGISAHGSGIREEDVMSRWLDTGVDVKEIADIKKAVIEICVEKLQLTMQRKAN